MLGRLAHHVLRHRVATGVLLLVLVLFAGWGATRIQLDFSSASFYGDESRARRDLEAFTERWGSDDRTLFVLARLPQTADGTLLQPERLSEIAVLSRRIERLSGVESTLSIATLQPLGSTELAQLAALPGIDLEARLRDAPVVIPLLVSDDLRSSVILVSLRQSTDDLSRAVDVVRSVEAVLHDTGDQTNDDGPASVRFELGGLPAVRAAFFELVIEDQLRFVPLTLVVIGLGLWLAFRRAHGVVLPALAAGLPVLFLVGTMGWIGEPIGLLNQAYFTLLPVIAVADSVHVLSRFHDERRGGNPKDAAARDEALVIATSRVGWAVALASLTTALGFASLAATHMPILRNFGLFAALGVVYAWVTVVIALPWLLAILPARWTQPPSPRHFDLRKATSSWVASLADFATRRRTLVLLLSGGLCAVAAVGFPRVQVDNRLSGLLDDDHPVAQTSRFIDRELGGVLSLEIELRRPSGWTDERARALLERTERALAGLETPRVVTSPATLGPLEELDLPSLIQGEYARISVRVPDAGGQAFAAFQTEVETLLQPLVSSEDVDMTITGTTALAYAGVNRITKDLRVSLIGVFFVVSAAMALLFRSVGTALRSMPPNVVPLIAGYGAVGWIGLQLDPLATVVLVLALGIAVDDTIHVLTRHAEEQDPDDRTRIVEALRHSGTAVMMTSLILAGGLSINLASSFPPLRVLGGLGSTVILLALAADLLLLPALMPRKTKASK